MSTLWHVRVCGNCAHRNVIVLAARAVHGPSELTGVGHHVIPKEAKVPLQVDALEHGGDGARNRVVARRDALRAHAVIARVDALTDDLPALGLGCRRVVQHELPEDVRRAVRSV